MKKIGLIFLVCMALMLAAAVCEPAGASTHHSAGSLTVHLVPVIPCSTEYGAGNPGPFVASQLPVDGPTHGVRLYSNGLITVLGPSGWTCRALVAADGGARLDVYPPGHSDYSFNGAPRGVQVVQVDTEYTGHGPGAEFICGLFPTSAAAAAVRQDQFRCQSPPARERLRHLTTDIVQIVDPPGVTGSLAGSGGSLTSVGAASYPQVHPDPGSVNVAKISCTLPASLSSDCSEIVSDYLTRNPPAYAGAS